MNARDVAEERIGRAIDYLHLFTSDLGSRVLADIKQRAYFGKTTFAAPEPGRPIDPYLSAFNEGKRTLCLEIMAEIELGKRGLQPSGRATPAVEPRTPDMQPVG